MKVISVLLSFCILQMGCSSSYVVSSAPNAGPSFSAFNADAEGRSGTIEFQDGRTVDAQNIIASPDSTLFVNGETGAIAVVPTHTVKEVVFTNHFTGFLEGFAYGTLAGAVTVLTMSAASHSGGEFSGWSYVVLFTLLGAGAGGVIGNSRSD
jgi:hypothetical protein